MSNRECRSAPPGPVRDVQEMLWQRYGSAAAGTLSNALPPWIDKGQVAKLFRPRPPADLYLASCALIGVDPLDTGDAPHCPYPGGPLDVPMFGAAVYAGRKEWGESVVRVAEVTGAPVSSLTLIERAGTLRAPTLAATDLVALCGLFGLEPHAYCWRMTATPPQIMADAPCAA